MQNSNMSVKSVSAVKEAINAMGVSSNRRALKRFGRSYFRSHKLHGAGPDDVFKFLVERAKGLEKEVSELRVKKGKEKKS